MNRLGFKRAPATQPLARFIAHTGFLLLTACLLAPLGRNQTNTAVATRIETVAQSTSAALKHVDLDAP